MKRAVVTLAALSLLGAIATPADASKRGNDWGKRHTLAAQGFDVGKHARPVWNFRDCRDYPTHDMDLPNGSTADVCLKALIQRRQHIGFNIPRVHIFAYTEINNGDSIPCGTAFEDDPAVKSERVWVSKRWGSKWNDDNPSWLGPWNDCDRIWHPHIHIKHSGVMFLTYIFRARVDMARDHHDYLEISLNRRRWFCGHEGDGETDICSKELYYNPPGKAVS